MLDGTSRGREANHFVGLFPFLRKQLQRVSKAARRIAEAFLAALERRGVPGPPPTLAERRRQGRRTR